MAMMMVLFMHDHQGLCKFFWIQVPMKYITAAVIYLIQDKNDSTYIHSVDEIF